MKSNITRKRLQLSNEKCSNKLLKNFEAVRHREMNETLSQILLEVLFPYLIAGIGMVGAGTVLNIVKQWKVFVNVSEVVILVPALLGLKGNLEMTLAARLSTQANLGTMDIPKECRKLIIGNMALTLFQAIVVGFLAAVLAIFLSCLQKGSMELSHVLLLISCSMTTAFMASVLLGFLMCAVVVLSRRINVNPDNVSTPVAGSLGDLTAVIFLAGSSAFFYENMETRPWLGPFVILLLCCSLPVWWNVCFDNEYTRQVLFSGWTPIIGAMTISSLGGVVLDDTIAHYKELARFQPVINGIGGNLVAIQASKLSTSLHRIGPLGSNVDLGSKDSCFWTGSFCKKNLGSKSAQALLLLVIPGHILFISVIWFFHSNDTELIRQTRNLSFILLYLLAAFIQVALLLHIAHGMVMYLWDRSLDPDTCSIPYLTAIGDLLGILLLACAFYFHSYF